MKTQEETSDAKPLKLRFRPLDAARLKLKFDSVRHTANALKKANVIRPAFLKSRVGI
jgi:hypothetical protein